MKNAALILVDIQKGFDNVEYWGGERNNLDAEKNANRLLFFWRQSKLPLFHVQHCSHNPDSLLNSNNKGNEFKDLVRPLPGEQIIQKSVNSAFIGTNLKDLLDLAKIDTVILCGFTTDHCVSTTARMAANLGYNTIVVADASVSFRKAGINNEFYDANTIHLTALAHLKGEFAEILNTEDLISSVDK